MKSYRIARSISINSAYSTTRTHHTFNSIDLKVAYRFSATKSIVIIESLICFFVRANIRRLNFPFQTIELDGFWPREDWFSAFSYIYSHFKHYTSIGFGERCLCVFFLIKLHSFGVSHTLSTVLREFLDRTLLFYGFILMCLKKWVKYYSFASALVVCSMYAVCMLCVCCEWEEES